jgi:hypothetical protein
VKQPTATLFSDKAEPNAYRVEAIDDDGGCEISLFTGPGALDRAIAFAGGWYYKRWEDPEGLARY